MSITTKLHNYCLVFDFDGVVANVNIEQALIAAQRHQINFLIPPEQILVDYFYHNPQNTALDLGQTTTDIVREAIRPSLWRGKREDWFKWWQAVEDAYQISEEMSRLLRELQIQYRLGLLTDNHLGFRRWLNQRPDINQYFDSVVCSAEVGLKKPDIALFQLIIDQLGATFETTIYLDDDINNTNAAQKLGIHSIHFQSFPQTRQELETLLNNPNHNS